ncbi:MAG TPA: ABC transporter substrate-binding protein [Thermodesulfovibrionia bacterium]|nr:ABC transporter substrate-binding protein [Thermodesulfovibrionia bacterium]
MILKWFGVFAFFCLIFSMPITVSATAEPINVIQSTSNEILAILSNTTLTNEEKISQLSNIAEGHFFFEEMAKRTLALHWNDRTLEEKKSFVKTYKEFLKKTYAEKIDKYSGEKVNVLSQEVDENYAVVKTTVVNEQKQRETPVDYKMKLHKSEWKVYDIVVEGISLINNYRVQFNDMLNKSSFDDLMKQLNDKVQGKPAQTITS